jgi:hypothetical protein
MIPEEARSGPPGDGAGVTRRTGEAKFNGVPDPLLATFGSIDRG